MQLTIALTHLGGKPDQPVLLVGPSLGTRVERLWADVAARLPRHRVIGWDLPGHGASPAPAGAFTMTELAAGVMAALDAETGPHTCFDYAGDSVGGAVGLQLALDAPQRVQTLTVACSAAKFGTTQAWQERAALVREEGMAPMVATSPARWFGSTIAADPTPTALEAIADLASIDSRGYVAVCEALSRFDVRDRLSEVACPVLAIAGADDLATPPAVLAEVSSGVRDGHLVVLDGVGHLAPLEHPGRVAALIPAGVVVTD